MPQDKLKIAFFHRANDPYTLERIKYFCAQKHEVFSISFSSFNYQEEYQKEIKGVNVIRLRKHIIDKPTFIKRFSHYYELKKILKKIRPNVFHVVSALNLAYLNFDGTFVKVIENQGSDLISTPNKYKFLKPLYKHFYKKVDGIIQDSKLLYECSLNYIPAEKNDYNLIIEIGIDFNIFNETVSKGVVRKRYNLGDRPIIFHSRGISDLYNFDIVLKSIKIVKKVFPDCIYIFTTTLEKLNIKQKEIIISNNLEKNILFVGFQDRYKDLKYFYRDANINLSVPSSDSSPFSVYESMACLTPNIVTDLPWLYNKFIPGSHLITCAIRDEESLAYHSIELLEGKIKVDLKAAQKVVFEQINLFKENQRLENLYETLLSLKINKSLK